MLRFKHFNIHYIYSCKGYNFGIYENKSKVFICDQRSVILLCTCLSRIHDLYLMQQFMRQYKSNTRLISDSSCTSVNQHVVLPVRG